LAITVILAGVAAALRLRPAMGVQRDRTDIRYGLHEGLELVGKTARNGRTTYVVEDEDSKTLFRIPLRGCVLDTRFKNGQLRFRENKSNREGFIDKQGIITFMGDAAETKDRPKGDGHALPEQKPEPKAAASAARENSGCDIGSGADLRGITASNPFYKEAVKTLSGKFDEQDAQKRRVILNYCEHFRAAYTTKDIDFLRQVFSEQALIIVGNVVKTSPDSNEDMLSGSHVAFNLRSKRDYIARLSKAFAANRKIDVRFSEFKILRHPTIEGIYGVSLRQRYKSDSYSDDGYLFLLWDFRNKSMPLIHVRTWQPAASVNDGDDIINLMDFNFE